MSRAWTKLEHLIANKIVTPSEKMEQIADNFQIRISPLMQQRMGEEADDPIRAQFVPSEAEATILPEELDDPIGDERHSPVEGVVHRYPNRALLKVTQLCEVYCRFCFRKEMIGNKGESLSRDELQNAYRYFSEHPELWEVILTGGDPLILSNQRLSSVLHSLAEIPHIKTIRIHTRIPFMNPDRIDETFLSLCETIMEQGTMIIMVLHANHIAEIGKEASDALLRLRRAGILLISQSVLLKGVNDSFEALKALFEGLLENGVKPYYLHQMDLARGTSHFVVEKEDAQSLIRQLRQKLSGISVPHLIQEIPEGEGKVVLY